MSQSNSAKGGVATASAAGHHAKKSSIRPVLMIGGVVVVAIVCFLFWILGGRYVSTDDSYVDAAKVSLSTDVSGLVGKIYVRDNEHVVAGQPLFALEQSRFAIAVDSANAALAQVVLDVEADKHGYRVALAQISAQEAQVAKDQANFSRIAAVVGSGGATRQQYDNAHFGLEADQATLAQLRAVAQQQLAKLSGNADIDPKDTPAYLSALSTYNDAVLNQKNSIVRAPFTGTVSGVENLQPGMMLGAGTAAFGLVSASDIYITAEPKENQMTWVRPGQEVTITVDTYPDQSWKGIVQSISPVTGSQFAILPAQNSSGNWVKVVQRIPVRIQITSGPKDFVLRAGMSTEITVDTKHHRHLSDLF